MVLSSYDQVKERILPSWRSNERIYSKFPSAISNKRIQPSSQPTAKMVPLWLTAAHHTGPPFELTSFFIIHN